MSNKQESIMYKIGTLKKNKYMSGAAARTGSLEQKMK